MITTFNARVSFSIARLSAGGVGLGSDAVVADGTTRFGSSVGLSDLFVAVPNRHPTNASKQRTTKAIAGITVVLTGKRRGGI